MRSKLVLAACVMGALVSGALSTPALAAGSTPSCTISGTPRADVLVGTSGNDVICGGGGNDTIRGGGGNDTIRGEGGNDTIFAGAGNDRVSGGAGNDNLRGEAGNDALVGGAGRDSLTSGAGNDSCAVDSADARLDECRLDADAPVISLPDIRPLEVQAGQTAVFQWTVTDPSGVESSWVSIGGPPGWVTEWCGFAVPGTAVSTTPSTTTFELRCPIPANAPSQTYTVFLSANDALGNGTTQQTQWDFVVVGGSSDTAAPGVTAVRSPQSVTVDVPFTVELDARDETGVAGVYVWLMLTPGGFADPQRGLYATSPSGAALISGTAQAGTYSQEVSLATFAPPGTYAVWLSLRDTPGNRTFIDSGARVTVTG